MLNHFTKLLGREEDQITAMTFDPGIIDTAMQEEIRRDGAKGMPEGKHALFLKWNAKKVQKMVKRYG